MKHSLLAHVCWILLLPSCSNKFDGKDGVKTTYFPGTEIVQIVADYKNGKRIGELKEYYRNGQLKIKQFYKDDKLTDSSFFYHENGKLKEVQYVKDFKKEGTWKTFINLIFALKCNCSSQPSTQNISTLTWPYAFCTS